MLVTALSSYLMMVLLCFGITSLIYLEEQNARVLVITDWQPVSIMNPCCSLLRGSLAPSRDGAKVSRNVRRNMKKQGKGFLIAK
jgi:hypothetical protein